MTEIRAINPDHARAGEDGALPHNIEDEQQLLGAILTNNEIYDRIAPIIGAQHFYDPVHARVFEVAQARISKNALASPVTLKAFLEDDE
ncbi:MAG: DnaB-like helicase N-terminal domain-containing protein, partial [Paracoccaceae bacterium]